MALKFIMPKGAGFYVAHTPRGMWTIEQHRGRFLIELHLAGIVGDAGIQDMGSAPTKAKAIALASKADRELAKLSE